MDCYGSYDKTITDEFISKGPMNDEDLKQIHVRAKQNAII